MLAEMLADRLTRLELGLFRQIDGDVLGLPALVVKPLLHDLLVVDDFHTRLEDIERQPGEPVRVHGAELVLIAVVIRRPKNLVAHATLRHKSVRSFGWVGLDFFGLVKRVEVPAQHVIHRLFLGEPNCLVHLAKKQRLGDGAVLLLPSLEDDKVALRLGEDQSGNVEQRIGSAGVLDLPCERLDAIFLRLNRHVQLERRARWRIVPAKAPLLVEGPLAIALLKFRTLAALPVAARPAIPVAIAFAILAAAF